MSDSNSGTNVNQDNQDQPHFDLRRRYHSRWFWGMLLTVAGGPSFLLVSWAAFFGYKLRDFDTKFYVTFLFTGVALYNGFRLLAVPVRWFCSGCGRCLSHHVPWRCGFCKAENRKKSFLNRCENIHCEVEPKAYQCPHEDCTTYTYFTADCDHRHAAHNLDAAPKIVTTPNEQRRSERGGELEEREHEKRKLELDIDLAKLRSKLDPPQPTTIDARHERMNRMFKQIAEAELQCKTLQHSFIKETELLAEIDNNPDLDNSQKEQFKEIVSRKFEGLRIELGGDIRI